MGRNICRILFFAIFLLVLFPSQVMAIPARIGNEDINVRSSPSRVNNNNIIFQAAYGQVVEILAEVGEFYRVNLGIHRNVYVFREFVYRDINAQGVVVRGGATFFIVARENLQRRNAPDNIIGTLSENTRVEITGESVFFYRIVHNNRIGYVERARVNVIDHTCITNDNHYRIESSATCTSTGVRVLTCVVCGYDVRRVAIPHEPHIPSGIWVVAEEPTCQTLGIKVQSCIVCNAEVLLDSVPRLPHALSGIWVVLEAASCTSEGVRVQSCGACGLELLNESMPRLPHRANGIWILHEEPTCNTPGRRVQYCAISGRIAVSEYIPALTGLDHVYAQMRLSGNVFMPPIVTEQVCELCGYDGGIITSYAMLWLSPLLITVLATPVIVMGVVKMRAKKSKNFHKIGSIDKNEFDIEQANPQVSHQFCEQCGNSIIGTVKFCTKCGARIDKTSFK